MSCWPCWGWSPRPSFLHAFVSAAAPTWSCSALVLVLLLYTSFWAIFFWVGAAVALIPIYRASTDGAGGPARRRLAFAAALSCSCRGFPHSCSRSATTRARSRTRIRWSDLPERPARR